MIFEASDTIEEFDNDEWEQELDCELWISPDGDRLIAYYYMDDEVQTNVVDPDYRISMREEEFKYIFKDWIKVGDV